MTGRTPAREQHTTLIRGRNRHFVEAERSSSRCRWSAKRDDWDQQARLATFHALLAIAASLLEHAAGDDHSRQ